jgi:hypothetical protein
MVNVASSKRAELALIRWFDIIPEHAQATTPARQVYGTFFRAELSDTHAVAARELFPSLKAGRPIPGWACWPRLCLVVVKVSP